MAETEKRRYLVREAALGRIASQERLDHLSDVTTPPYWIVLSVIGGLLLTFMVWGVFGSLPVRVDGEGMLIRGGEVRAVTVPAPGQIEEILVSPGEVVKDQQPVARLNRSRILLDLGQCQGEASLAKTETEEAVQGMNRQLAELRQRERAVAELVQRGRLSRRDLYDLQRQITSITEEIQARRQRVRALEANCERLKVVADTDTVIRSVAAGRVIEVAVRDGDTVQAGTQILTIEPPGRLQAAIFIPAREGKRVRVGMPARISPSHVRPEEYGYLVARVSSCTAFPVTPEALKKVLRNESLAQRLLEQGPLFRIGLELEEDKSSSSGFRWTSKGPEESIDSGTIATASVEIERRRPISYVIPILGKALGGS